MKAENKEEIKKDEYTLVQVPTNHALAVETPEGEIVSQEQAIVLILNQLRELNKKL